MLVSLVPISSITASANENDIVIYGFQQVLPNQTVEEWKATRPSPISFSVDNPKTLTQYVNVLLPHIMKELVKLNITLTGRVTNLKRLNKINIKTGKENFLARYFVVFYILHTERVLL